MSSYGHYRWAESRQVGDPLAKALLIFIAQDTNPLEYRMMAARGSPHYRPPMEAMASYFQVLELSFPEGEGLVAKLLAEGHLVEHFGYVPAWPEPAPEPRRGQMPRKRRRIYERDGWKCVYCGSTDDLSLDHVRARKRGGGDDDSNLVTACRSCNSSKGDRPLSVWRPGFDLVGDVV